MPRVPIQPGQSLVLLLAALVPTHTGAWSRTQLFQFFPQTPLGRKQHLQQNTALSTAQEHTVCRVAAKARPTLRLLRAGSGGAPSPAAGPPRAEALHPRDPHPALRRTAASRGIPRLCGNDASARTRQRQGYVRQLPPQRSFYRSIINPGAAGAAPAPSRSLTPGTTWRPRPPRREAGRGGAVRPARR